ncbi:LysR substrate-binding domain-containing protein [Phyllobacterium myrsinacearum]|uniref:DNA-binding transcriptional LysR family regulator n=1 Tax=Phyllobacterium myrsinacearum TaxID=28101 RepID=A0A839EF03_9HYPH|nr:LysR substrate-binding domain-containing protein [Phyllobacterium myrsinacearum]MBA8877502.1 DNA-binding transcriptional LysR family regulator [Phyllobacterium myrsinacearum]
MAAPLDLDLLRTFVIVVETGSLSAAAPRVGRSQSAVSMQMQRLEQAVGKQLLIRNPRSVEPNLAGESFLNYARRLLRLSDEAWANVTRPEETGSVRLGVPDDYAAFLLPPVLSRFAAEHPLVTVELVCEQSTSLVKAIDEDRVNLAILTRGATQPLEVIRRERLIWVASPTHVAWENDPLPIALFEPGCAARMNVLDALGDADRSYRCTYSSASLLGLIAVVQAGLAVAALAACSVPSTLRVIGENEGLPPLHDLEIGIMRSPVSSSPAIDRLDDFLRRELAQIN